MKPNRKRPLRHPQAKKKTGLPPGELVYIGSARLAHPVLKWVQCNERQCTQKEVTSPTDFSSLLTTKEPVWLHVCGLSDTQLISALGDAFQISPLALEDVVNTNSRPKADNYGQYVFIIMKLFQANPKSGVWEPEQVSLIFGTDFLITLQESECDLFADIRNRLLAGTVGWPKRNMDFLAYLLVDRIVDEYFVALESIGERIELLETLLDQNPDGEFLKMYNALKQESLFIRKAVWPLREALNYLMHLEEPLVRPTTLPFLRDVYDHVVQVMDTIEVHRDLISDLKDLYLSRISLRLNGIMKTLTIIATIFIPLTFIVGIYGMNFHYMPELEWRFGYLFIWIVMLAVAGTLIFYFRKQKWL